MIEKYCFLYLAIEELNLQSNFECFQDEWLLGKIYRDEWDCKLTQIKTSNDNFIYYKNQLLLSKSNNDYDTIYFVRPDISEVEIPKTIKYINPCLFQFFNRDPFQIIFESNSRLESFE